MAQDYFQYDQLYAEFERVSMKYSVPTRARSDFLQAKSVRLALRGHPAQALDAGEDAQKLFVAAHSGPILRQNLLTHFFDQALIHIALKSGRELDVLIGKIEGALLVLPSSSLGHLPALLTALAALTRGHQPVRRNGFSSCRQLNSST